MTGGKDSQGLREEIEGKVMQKRNLSGYFLKEILPTAGIILIIRQLEFQEKWKEWLLIAIIVTSLVLLKEFVFKKNK